METKRCTICQQDKPLDAFRSIGRQCKACLAEKEQARRNDPEYVERKRAEQRIIYAEKMKTEAGRTAIWANMMWYLYRLRVADYNALVDAQGGGCATCGRTPTEQDGKRLAIDHDHSCCPGKKTCGRCVRGVLCDRCNTVAGHVEDDVVLMHSIVTYLEKTRGR